MPVVTVRELEDLNLDVYLKIRKREDIYLKCLNERGAVIDPNYTPLE